MFSFNEATQNKNTTPTHSSTSSSQYSNAEPVDIPYDKFKEWLMDRNLLAFDHLQELKKVRAYIKHALNETKIQHKQIIEKDDKQAVEKEKKVEQLLNEIRDKAFEIQDEEEAVVDYTIAKRIRDTIEEVDGSSGGFLFGLVGGSKRLKLWRHVVQSYETKFLYMAELATLMVNNVKYEIPALRKNIVKVQKQLDDLNHKEQEWKKSISSYKKQYNDECAELSIEGVDVDNEIPKSTAELNSHYQKIIDALSTDQFEQALHFYTEFASFVSNKDLAKESSFLSSLRYLLENKNDSAKLTIYEYKKFRNEKLPEFDPIELEKHKQKKQEQESFVNQIDSLQENASVEIDWSALDSVVEPSDTDNIVWTDSEIDTTGKTVEIDFGDETFGIETADIGNEGSTSAEIEIDWSAMDDAGISSVDASENDEQKYENILKLMNNSLLADDEIRNVFIDHVIEIEAFIKNRIHERRIAENSANDLDSEIFRNAPSTLKNQAMDQLKRYEKAVRDVLERLNDPRFRQLILIKTSKKYVERITKTLKQKLEMADKLELNLTGVDSRRSELQQQIQNVQPQINKLVTETLKAQDYLQLALSKELKRPVHLFGEITALRTNH